MESPSWRYKFYFCINVRKLDIDNRQYKEINAFENHSAKSTLSRAVNENTTLRVDQKNTQILKRSHRVVKRLKYRPCIQRICVQIKISRKLASNFNVAKSGVLQLKSLHRSGEARTSELRKMFGRLLQSRRL